MFKKGDKIVYPTLGAGRIKSITTEIIDKKKIDYYEIVLKNSEIDISIPIKNAEELGLQPLPTKASLKRALKKLKQPKIKDQEQMTQDFEEYANKILKSADPEKIADLINKIFKIKNKRAKDNRDLTITQNRILESAQNFMKSLIPITLGRSINWKAYHLE
jgi:RNA polymerase-interacting CarD/CdnL/TRCF family regulator